jgi:2-keto-4-pentenoate hydratase
MNQADIQSAATMLWQNWQQQTRIDELPEPSRPNNRAEAYAIQAELARVAGQEVVGWKIAATSLAGQKHIGVDGPLAGRLFAQRVLTGGATVSLEMNLMRVAEAEFAFRFAQPLPKRAEPYTVAEVLAAVETLHPAIEIPDSRYHDYVRAGGLQMIADDACASWFLLGEPTTANWREMNLVTHTVNAYKNDALAATGTGINVLGDPRVALTWIANELSTYGEGLRAGEFVTTGTCITPLPIAPGDQLRFDFGDIGVIDAILSP